MLPPQSFFVKALSPVVGSCSLLLICSITFSFLGKYHWILDLCAHFRVQYLICSLPLIVPLFILKRPKLGVTLLLLTLINTSLLLPHYITQSTSAQEKAPQISTILLNVNTQLGSPSRVEAFLLEIDPDFIILQEIDDKWVQSIPEILSTFPHHCIRTRNDNFGIGLFSKYPLTYKEIKYIGEAQLPTISAVIDFKSTQLNVIATHTLPPRGQIYSALRNDQLEQLAKYAATKTLPTILLGDLNTTQFSFHFKNFLEKSKLIDSSTHHGIQPTWPSFSSILGIQIDHFLHSNEIITIDKYTGAKVGSDHSPVIVNFQIRE